MPIELPENITEPKAWSENVVVSDQGFNNDESVNLDGLVHHKMYYWNTRPKLANVYGKEIDYSDRFTKSLEQAKTPQIQEPPRRDENRSSVFDEDFLGEDWDDLAKERVSQEASIFDDLDLTIL